MTACDKTDDLTMAILMKDKLCDSIIAHLSAFNLTPIIVF